MPKKVLTQSQIDREVQRSTYVQAASEPTAERRVTVVIARSALDFQHWCEEHGKNPRDRNYLMATPATARGLREAHLELTAEGMWRPDIHVLMTNLVPLLDRPSRKRLQDLGWGGDPPGLA